MYVIGTAGHVDHGKSTLVKALTGIDPDRLKEEREREMTIDLGFAWFDLPDGEQVGVVDVPGHRDFIENMLAGVGGIDAALLVVAADEGPMPQTREHLAILDLLEIPAGVVALTKADLIDDADWLYLVSGEIGEMLSGTALADAPLIPVSARTGEGLDTLLNALQACLAASTPRPDLGRPRLPIDRVFTVAGFGTVVTGTLLGGSLQVGDEVQVLPAGQRARIRGLQTHKTKRQQVQPGSRVAVNLTGVEIGKVDRGAVLAYPGTVPVTGRVDVLFRHLDSDDVDLPLKHNSEVKLFVGAAEVIARVRVLGAKELLPGEQGWLQLMLREPIAAARGDRFILRRPSPAATIGGGIIVDPTPHRRHKRNDPNVLARLQTLAEGTPGEMLLQAVEALGIPELRAAASRAGMDDAGMLAAIAELEASGDLINLEGRPLTPTAKTLVVGRVTWQRLRGQMVDLVAGYHQNQPLRAGLPREELKSRLQIPSSKAFNALVGRAVAAGDLVELGAYIHLPDFEVRFDGRQQRQVDSLLVAFQHDPYNTPSIKRSLQYVGEDVLAALIAKGALVQLSADVLFLAETVEYMQAEVIEMLRQNGSITIAQARDMFATSRKYALALMEYLDQQGLTRRDGDMRRLR